MNCTVDDYGRLIYMVSPDILAAPPAGPIVPPMPDIHARSSRWPAFLHELLIKHPACMGCGRKAATGHHEIPFHVDPTKELVESNILTVCVPCHFVICHAGDWRLWVKSARLDLQRHLRAVQTSELAG